MTREDLFTGPACSLRAVLEARDRRAEAQKAQLAACNMPLISLTLNLPGACKRFPLADRFFAFAREQAEAAAFACGVVSKPAKILYDDGGCTALFSVDAPPANVKAAMIALEDDAPVARLIDADVFDADGTQLCRAAFGAAPRQCFLCGKPAKQCASVRAHTLPEIEAHARRLLTEWYVAEESERIGRQAQRALLYEVAVTPKPGLVDRSNSGAHRDMDFYTFLDSAVALAPYFAACARMGLTAADGSDAALFQKLRSSGILAERRMREATKSINTHMGAIFSLGLLSAATGRLLSRSNAFSAEEICEEAGRLAAFSPVPGGKAPTGARQEAMAGFPSLTALALPRMHALLSSGMPPDRAGSETLLLLMSQVSDQNAIRRGGESALALLRQSAAAILEAPYDAASIERFDRTLIQANISPGGSADLLAACFFLCFIER